MKKLTYFEAVSKTEQVWEWLCDNPEKTKDDFTEFDLEEFEAQCPMCEWDEQRSFPKQNCKKCFLDKEELCFGGDGKAYSIYCEKNNIGGKFNNKSYAARLAIYNACLEERLRIM